MKVEANAQANAKGGVNPVQTQNRDSQTIVLLSLLRKAAKDILKDIQDYKIDNLESTKNSKGKTATAGAQAPKSTDATESPESSGDAILEALIAQLNVSDTINKVSKASVQKLISFVLSQLSGLGKLQQQIQALKKELSGNIPESEIKALQTELRALEVAYDAALAGYNSASGDYNKNQKSAAAAAKAYNQAEQTYNNLPDKDKSGPAGQKLQKEMAAAKLAESTANSAMASDQTTMKTAEAAMKTAEAGLSAIASKYPSISKNIDALIAVMKDHGSVSSAASTLNKQVASIGAQDEKLAGEISSLESQKQAIINAVSHGSSTIKKALEQFLESSKTISAEAMTAILNSFLGTVIAHETHRGQNEADKEVLSRLTHKTVETRHATTAYRHLDQKATHDIAVGR